MREKIKLNKQGFEQYLAQLEKKEQDLAKVRKYKGEVAIYQGDTWHDNPSLYHTELQERALMRDIYEMKQKLANDVEIVENIGDENLVDIDDIIKVDMIFSNNESEEEIFKLVATAPDFTKDVKEISINSPLGASVYHKKVGDYSKYNVQDENINIYIKEKITMDLENIESNHKKTR